MTRFGHRFKIRFEYLLECDTGNSIQDTSVSEIQFKTRVSARTICLMHMSDGVLFTGLMEMHSIGDLEMLTGNSIQNTSVSSHHHTWESSSWDMYELISVSWTWKCIRSSSDEDILVSSGRLGWRWFRLGTALPHATAHSDQRTGGFAQQELLLCFHDT